MTNAGRMEFLRSTRVMREGLARGHAQSVELVPCEVRADTHITVDLGEEGLGLLLFPVKAPRTPAV